MYSQEPTAQQLREILTRATDLSSEDIELAVKRLGRGRVVRWGALERAFARRALAAHARRSKP